MESFFFFHEQIMRWVGHIALLREMRVAYEILVRKAEGKRPLGRPRHTLEYNTRMDYRETGLE
jgi:hypothetical protein